MGCGDELPAAHLHEQRLRANEDSCGMRQAPYNRGMEIHLRHIQALSGCLRHLGSIVAIVFRARP